eukprot:355598-Chlamydomonas_euryale.AAC.2
MPTCVRLDVRVGMRAFSCACVAVCTCFKRAGAHTWTRAIAHLHERAHVQARAQAQARVVTAQPHLEVEDRRH